MTFTLLQARTPGRFGPLFLAFVILGALVRTAGAAVPPPINDNCSGAILIPGAGPFPVSTDVVNITNATTTGEAGVTPDCQMYASHGVWYKFRPVSSAFYTVTSGAPATTTVEDTVISVYTALNGCAGPFVSVACNDDISYSSHMYKSSVTAQLLADTDYYIVVWSYDDLDPDNPLVLGGQSTLQLVVSREITPLNDTCVSAVPVFLNIPVFGSTVAASNNYRLSGTAAFSGVSQKAAAGMGRDVIYSFTAHETGDYSFKASGYKDEPGFDLLLYVGDYCAPGQGVQTLANALAASNRNSAGTAEEILCIALTDGQLVYIYVDDTNFNGGSSFSLEVSRCVRETEPNNTPAIASRLACGIEGSISPNLDVDFYAVGSFPPGSRLFAMMIGDAANLPPDFRMRVTTLEDTLEYDARVRERSPSIAGTPLPGGPVFIRVNGVGLLEPYRLYAVVQPPTDAAAIEVEPNDSLATAHTSPANYFYGSLTGPPPSTDQDLYRFTALGGESVFVSLDADPTRDGSKLDALLELLDESGTSLLMVNNLGPMNLDLTGTTNSTDAENPDFPGEGFVYRCARGTYFVRVSVGTTDPATSGAGDYLISIAKNCIPGALGARFLGLSKLGDGHMLLQLEGTPLATYRIESTGNLDASWSDIGGATADGVGALSFEDISPAPDSRFYRAVPVP